MARWQEAIPVDEFSGGDLPSEETPLPDAEVTAETSAPRWKSAIPLNQSATAQPRWKSAIPLQQESAPTAPFGIVTPEMAATVDPALSAAQGATEVDPAQASWKETAKAVPTNFVEGARLGVGGAIRSVVDTPLPSQLQEKLERDNGVPARRIDDTPEAQASNAARAQHLKALGATLQSNTETGSGTPIGNVVGGTAKFGREMTDTAHKNLEAATPENLSFWQDATLNAAQSLGISVPALIATFLMKSPAPALAAMGITTYGQSYDQYVRAGVDPNTAKRAALVDGAVEVVTEKIPLQTMMKMMGGAPFIKSLMHLYGQEIVTENIATLLQNANQYATEHPDATFKDWQKDYIEQIPEQAAQTTAATAIISTLHGGAAHLASKIVPRGTMDATQPPPVPAPIPPQAQARADLESALADSRPYDEIKAERDAHAAQQAQEAATVAAEQQTQQQAAQQQEMAVLAESAGLPAPGTDVVSTLPGGQSVNGKLVGLHQDNGVTYASIQAEDGNQYDLATNEVQIRLKPAGDGTRTAPVKVGHPDDVAIATQQVAEPTPAQAEAGNYQHGHLQWNGLDISIETPRGAERTGTDKEGKPWSSVSPANYGYFKGTTAADGDHVDVYLGDKVNSKRAYVIDQIDPDTGKYDEAKVLAAFATPAEAVSHYQAAFSDGKNRIGAITPMSVAQIKTWLDSGATKKPLKYVQPETSNAIEARQEQVGNQQQYSGVPSRPNVPAHGAEIRQGEGGQASSGGGLQRGTVEQPLAQSRGAPQVERRTDIAQRKRVAEMSHEELKGALLTDPLTGLPNRRAYDEADKKAIQVAIDVDGLKVVNDNLGHEAGDQMLRIVGQAMKESGLDAYHISGDEFLIQANGIGVENAVKRVMDRLLHAEIIAELPNGTQITRTGVGFSYGLGGTRNEADAALYRHKAERKAQGLRAERKPDPERHHEPAQGQQVEAHRTVTPETPVVKTPKGALSPESVLAEIKAAGQTGLSPRSATWRMMAKRLVRDGKAAERDGKFSFTEPESAAPKRISPEELSRRTQESGDHERKANALDAIKNGKDVSVQDARDAGVTQAPTGYVERMGRYVPEESGVKYSVGKTNNVHANAVEYITRDLLKGKSLKVSVNSFLKKFNGQDNMFLGGKVEYTAEQLTRAVMADKAQDAIKAARRMKDGMGFMALKATAQQFNLPETELAKEIAKSTDGQDVNGLLKEHPNIIGGGGVKYSVGTKPTFYSALERGIDSVQQPKAPAAQWKAIINNLSSKGVKPDEVQWSGIQEWLDEQKGSVTKEQVTNYLRANQIQVKEVMLGEGGSEEYKSAAAKAAQLNEKAQALRRSIDADLAARELRGSRKISPAELKATIPFWGAALNDKDTGRTEEQMRSVGLDDSQMAKIKEYGAAHVAAIEADHERDELKTQRNTKFETYTLPGGENYRELLLMIPPTINELPQWKVIRPDGHVDSTYVSEASARVQADRRGDGYMVEQTPTKQVEGGFRSSHFSEPNIVAHIRFNDRTDADGKKVLFLEELQSDWAQKGKREGFSKPPQPSDIKVIQTSEGSWGVQVNGELMQESRDRDAAEHAAERMRDNPATKETSTVPSGPFVTKTDSWVSLALKRMIRYAAENGYDRIAFTTGEQQADRYDLSKRVALIDYQKRDDGSYRIIAIDPNGRNIISEDIEEQRLPDYVGKEVADKIIKGDGEVAPNRGNPNSPFNRLTGLDLKVGGEGMKKFYDQIVPFIVNKYVKKWNSRVSETSIGREPNVEDRLSGRAGANDENISFKAHSIDITPQMKQAALSGQPLFSTGADFSYRYLADQAKLIERIQKLAQQMNPDAKIEFVPQLFGAGEAVLRSGAKTPERQSVAGSYDPAQRLITLALNYADPETTFRHETLHDLRELGLFKPTEWKLLEHEAEKTWKQEYGIPDNEEAIASAFGDYRGGKTFESGIQTIFNKIRSFFTRIGNMLRGMGFNTVDDVFQRVERGEVAARDAKPLGRQDIVHATANESDQTQTPEFKKWFGDSKVVDENGKPLVVYHGTDAVFSKFHKNTTGRARGTRYGKGAFFFTSNTATASSYAMAGRDHPLAQPNVMPAYLNLRNPIEIDAHGGSWTTVQQRIIAAQRQGNDGAIIRDVLDVVDPTDDEAAGPVDVFVAFDSDQIKSAIGNIGTFDARNPDIRYSAGKKPKWLDKQSAEVVEAARKAGVWMPDKTLKQRFDDIKRDIAKRMVQGMVDQFAPIKELDYRSYVLARMSKSSDSGLEAMLFYGKPFLDDDGALDIHHEKDGLIGVLQKLQGEHDRFMAWIAGNRAARLKTEGRENLFTDTDITSLKGLSAGQMPDGKQRAAVYFNALREFNGYSKSVLDIAEKAGLIDPEARKIWEKDFYVPFYRQIEDDQKKARGPSNIGGLTKQYAFKQLKGGEEVLNDLLQNTLRNWSHLLSASLKNQAAASTLIAAVKAGVATPATQHTKDAVWFSHEGRKQYVTVDDPFILDAISALEWSGFKGTPMKVMGKFKKALTFGVTISPTFRIRNLIRDSLQATAVTPASLNVMKNVVQGWKVSNKNSEDYPHLLAGGGLMRFGMSIEGEREQYIKDLIDKGVEKSSIWSKTNARLWAEKVWEAWKEVGDKSESITRAAIYKQLKEKGESHLMASYAARDSMDFSMRGSWPAIRFLTQVVPFMNARAQGLYKLGRDGITPTSRVIYNTVTGKPIEASDKAKAARFGAVLGATTLFSLGLLLAYRGDPDWDKREEWDRDNFWWFKIGNKAFRIPKPFEIGAMASVAERGLEAMLDGLDATARKRFADRFMAILSDNLSMNPIPQIIKPWLDVYANKDSFTGRPIETAGMEKLSPSERAGPNTSTVAKIAGKAGALSPVQIDHMIRGYFGWLGAHAAMTVDLALQPFSDNKKPTKRTEDMFVIGDFIKDLPANESRFVSQFYDQAKQVQQVMADVRHYKQLGDYGKVESIYNNNEEKLSLYKMYDHAQRRVSKINTELKRIQVDTAMTPQQKRAEIDALNKDRNEIVKEVEDARKQALRDQEQTPPAAR